MTIIEEATIKSIRGICQKLSKVTLRDLFAMSALQTITNDNFTFEECAELAYQQADAMIEARDNGLRDNGLKKMKLYLQEITKEMFLELSQKKETYKNNGMLYSEVTGNIIAFPFYGKRETKYYELKEGKEEC